MVDGGKNDANDSILRRACFRSISNNCLPQDKICGVLEDIMYGKHIQSSIFLVNVEIIDSSSNTSVEPSCFLLIRSEPVSGISVDGGRGDDS